MVQLFRFKDDREADSCYQQAKTFILGSQFFKELKNIVRRKGTNIVVFNEILFESISLDDDAGEPHGHNPAQETTIRKKLNRILDRLTLDPSIAERLGNIGQFKVDILNYNPKTNEYCEDGKSRIGVVYFDWSELGHKPGPSHSAIKKGMR